MPLHIQAEPLLAHLQAYEQGLRALRLETGVYPSEALGLYQRFGFRRIPPSGPLL